MTDKVKEKPTKKKVIISIIICIVLLVGVGSAFLLRDFNFNSLLTMPLDGCWRCTEDDMSFEIGFFDERLMWADYDTPLLKEFEDRIPDETSHVVMTDEYEYLWGDDANEYITQYASVFGTSTIDPKDFLVVKMYPDSLQCWADDHERTDLGLPAGYSRCYIIKTNDTNENIIVYDCNEQRLFKMELVVVDTSNVPSHDKPVIYLYPETETKVHVQLSKPENITCDYPEYNEGWNVIAKPNGNLHDVASGKDLYCLYYECSADASQVEEDGFVVKSADIADFLDEKLEILGLNDKERNEFIIYWLPKLEQNKYNYIRFLTKAEIDEAEELNVNPKPDSVIRIMMSYKGLDKPINVREQKLKTAERAGFTVVEWGGTEIK